MSYSVKFQQFQYFQLVTIDAANISFCCVKIWKPGREQENLPLQSLWSIVDPAFDLVALLAPSTAQYLTVRWSNITQQRDQMFLERKLKSPAKIDVAISNWTDVTQILR